MITWQLQNLQRPSFAVSRTSRPATSTGSGVATLITALARGVNDLAQGHIVTSQLEQLNPRVERMIPAGSRSGVLAVVLVREHPAPFNVGPSAWTFHSVYVWSGVFPDPQTALRSVYSSASVETGGTRRLFYWGTRQR
jgi:hypothetical protein